MWLAARTLGVAVLLVTMRYAAVMGSVVEQLDRAGVFAGIDRVPERASTLVRDMERPWAGRLVPSAVAGEMRPFFDYVERCIPPDQRLLVAAWLPEVAVLSQRPFAGGQLWFMPGALKTRPITSSSCGGSIASVCRSPCFAARRTTSWRSSFPSSTPTSSRFTEIGALVTWRW